MTSIRFDNSLLSSTYCTTRALLRHVHGLTTPRDEQKTQAGRAAHEALAVYFQGGSVDVAMMQFEHYRAVAPDREDDRLSYDNTSQILRQWFDTHPIEGLPFVVLPELVEVPFEIELAREKSVNLVTDQQEITQFLFTGRIDAIVQDRHTGWLHVMDNKTSGNIDTKQFGNDSQMSGYVWAASQSGHKVQGAYINAIQFSLLPGMKGNGHYKCRTHKRMTAYPGALEGTRIEKERAAIYDECRLEHCTFELPLKTRTPDQLEAWRTTALSMARKYSEMSTKYPKLEDVAAAPQEGTFYYQGCKFCPFTDFCASGRPVQWAESMLTYSPWSPLP